MKKWLKPIGIIVGILVFLWLIGFFRHLTSYNQVEKIVLRTYDHSSHGEVELTEAEAKKIIALYNLSREAGEINAEPCCSEYGCYIYFKDGTHLWIGEGIRSKLILNPGTGERCYMDNSWLIDYMEELAIKYDLPLGEDWAPNG